MLGFLQDKTSDRKLRLFAVACGRRLWHLLASKRSQRAIEVGESYADGLVARSALVAASRAAASAGMNAQQYAANHDDNSLIWPSRASPAWAARAASLSRAWSAAAEGSLYAMRASEPVGPEEQCQLLCDIVGNPFRPLTIDPSWLTPTVRALAVAAYENRDLPAGTLQHDHLAVLADALEDAGCTSPAVLVHFRSPGPHVRGCHVLDLILNKDRPCRNKEVRRR